MLVGTRPEQHLSSKEGQELVDSRRLALGRVEFLLELLALQNLAHRLVIPAMIPTALGQLGRKKGVWSSC